MAAVATFSGQGSVAILKAPPRNFPIAVRTTPVPSHCVLAGVCANAGRTTPYEALSCPTPFITFGSLFLSRPPPPMLLCPLLALCIIPYYPVSAQPVEPEMSATNAAPSVTSSSPGHNLDARNLGSTIGGEQGIYFNPIERSDHLHIPIRCLCCSYRGGFDCAGICDASPVTKTKLPIPQQRAGGDRVVPPVSEAERDHRNCLGG